MSRKKAVVSGPETPISQRAYSRHRGCRVSAVQRAIAEGRLVTSLTTDAKGHKKIISVELADAEWAAKTGPTAEDRAENEEAQRSLPDAEVSYQEAKRRRAIEDLKNARVASEHNELDIAERRGDLLSASKVRSDVADAFARVRTKMLGVPTRCKQRIQGITNADVGVITDLVREALEELSDGE